MEIETAGKTGITAGTPEETGTDQKVLWGEVVRVGRPPDRKGMSWMVVQPQGRDAGENPKCVIYRDEADAEFTTGTLEYLIGRRVPYVVLSGDAGGGRVLGSRKRAQQILKREMMPDLIDGTEMCGTILNFVSFGAFVEVHGVVGLLKNTDFSSDYSEVSERYRAGDTIMVRCREVNRSGKIFWTVREKHNRTVPVQYDFEPDTCVIGTVKDIHAFPHSVGAFVRIAPGLDALCSIPDHLDAEAGARVAVRIVSVRQEDAEGRPPRIRGRILCCI